MHETADLMLAKSTARKIFKEAGAKRVSEEALDEYTQKVNKFAYSMAKKAVRLAEHAKRKTVEKSDVELAE